jgi:hypothetical protein
MENQIYQIPQLSVVEVVVEQGYSGSLESPEYGGDI